MNNGYVPFLSTITGKIIIVEITVGTKLGKQPSKVLKVAENSFSFNSKKKFTALH